MSTTGHPDGYVITRQAALVERVKARRLSKRQLATELAHAEWLLEVRTTAFDRVVAHNAKLEAELRALIGADALIVAADDLSPFLVETLIDLGAKYGPLGVIRAALTILGGPK